MGDHKHHDDHGHSHAHHGDAAHAGEPLPPLRLQAGSTEKGHEVDLTPDRNLFGFLGAMTVLLVATAVGVWQLFLMHNDNVLAAAANKPSPLVTAQADKDAKFFETYGKATPEEGVTTLRVPVPEARKLVLGNPSRFAAAPAPEGWTHPDDIAR
jgi:hypothetical protein